MSDVDEVIGLLERWRDATGMGRVRIGIDATRTIGGLPPGRKRELAVEVARRVAPQLVPAIEAEDGDLSGEQVAAIIDLLRRADRDQLDELVDALRDGDLLEALDIADEAVTIVAPPPPLPVPDIAPGPDLPLDPEPDRIIAAEPVMDVDVEPDTTAELAEIDEAAVRAAVEAEAALRANRWLDVSAETSHQPAYRAPSIDFGSLIVAAPSDEQALAAAAGGASGDHVLLQPDGYRRRRAALAAIAAGTLHDDNLVQVVASFSRATDRAWVAGAALDAGVVTLADVAALLPASATSRLARRVTSTDAH